MSFLFKKIICLLFFIGSLFWIGTIQAVEIGGLGIYPANPDPNQSFSKARFNFLIEAGKEAQDKVAVVNNFTDKPVRVRVWAVDGVMTKDGSLAPAPESEKRDVGAWISLAESEFDLAPKEKKIIDFTLRVPANAEVGDHVGAIMAKALDVPEATTEQKTDKVESGFKVVTQVGSRVYLTVPGEMVRSLKFNSFSWERRVNKKIEEDLFYFILKFKNEGNVRAEPAGKILVKNWFGQTVAEISVLARPIFPKNEVDWSVQWGKPMIGSFTAIAELIYNDQTLTKKVNFFIWPPKTIMVYWGVGLGLLLTIILLVVLSAKKFMASVARAGRGDNMPSVIDLRRSGVSGSLSQVKKKKSLIWFIIMWLIIAGLLVGLFLVAKLLWLK